MYIWVFGCIVGPDYYGYGTRTIITNSYCCEKSFRYSHQHADGPCITNRVVYSSIHISFILTSYLRHVSPSYLRHVSPGSTDQPTPYCSYCCTAVSQMFWLHVNVQTLIMFRYTFIGITYSECRWMKCCDRRPVYLGTSRPSLLALLYWFFVLWRSVKGSNGGLLHTHHKHIWPSVTRACFH